jgi:hypothetical protein
MTESNLEFKDVTDEQLREEIRLRLTEARFRISHDVRFVKTFQVPNPDWMEVFRDVCGIKPDEGGGTIW